MSNVFTELPVPLGNGNGTAVDVSTFGGTKTVVVVGTARSAINIEFNNSDDPALGSWQSLTTIHNSGSITVSVAARWMRASVSAYNTRVGGTSSVHVGATDAGATFVELPVPAGNGVGDSVDVSSALLGLFKTVQVGGPFRGSLIVEVSVDGDEWAQPFAFYRPNAESTVVVARLMRVKRAGVPPINPGLPVVNVGATTLGEGGGGGGTSTLVVFDYIVTGEEPDLSELTIPLPTAQTAVYGVTCTCQSVVAIVAFDIPRDQQTTTEFVCIATAELQAGDRITFFVSPLTSSPT